MPNGVTLVYNRPLHLARDLQSTLFQLIHKAVFIYGFQQPRSHVLVDFQCCSYYLMTQSIKVLFFLFIHTSNLLYDGSKVRFFFHTATAYVSLF